MSWKNACPGVSAWRGTAKRCAGSLACLAGLIIALSSCGGKEDLHGAGDDTAPFGAPTENAVQSAFTDVDVGACLADVTLRNREVLVIGCEVPGSMPVVAVESLGNSAPVQQPAGPELNKLAKAACSPNYKKWGSARGLSESGYVQAVVVEEVWRGSQTHVICAASVPSVTTGT